MEYAERVTGISAETLKKVAHMIAEADGVGVCWAMGVTHHCIGSDTSTAISNLLLLTGNYMRPGAGSYPLRGHNNVQGVSDMGAVPDRVSGYQSVAAPSDQSSLWNPHTPARRRSGAQMEAAGLSYAGHKRTNTELLKEI